MLPGKDALSLLPSRWFNILSNVIRILPSEPLSLSHEYLQDEGIIHCHFTRYKASCIVNDLCRVQCRPALAPHMTIRPLL